MNRERLFFLSRKGLKAIFALLPLLGVTFLLGFFVDCHVAVEYAFVLFNSIQVKCMTGLDNIPVFFGYFSCDFEFLVLKMGEQENKGDAAINNKGKMYEDSLS